MRILKQSTWMHCVLLGRSRKCGRNMKTRRTGSTSNLLKRKYWSSIRHDRTQWSFTTHSQLTVSRKLSWWKLEKSKNEKVYASPRRPPKISFIDNWMKRLVSEIAGTNEDSQQNQPKTKILLKEQGDLFVRANIQFECSGNRKRFFTWQREYQSVC